MARQTKTFKGSKHRLAEHPLHSLAHGAQIRRAAIHQIAAALFGEVGHVEP